MPPRRQKLPSQAAPNERFGPHALLLGGTACYLDYVGSRRKQRLLLEVAATDRTFEHKELDGAPILEGKCIHCQRKLALRADGTPINGATLEHIVPKNHGGTDDLENLAIACARCNSEKGLHHDHKRADDPKLRQVIERLQERRRKRFRPGRKPG